MQDFNNDQAKKIITNYLNIARDKENEELYPFDISGVNKLNELVEGNARKFLKNGYFMVEKALEIFDKKTTKIDAKFIVEHFSRDNI
ncbi:MAG: hypothetical protein M0D57_04665 [Sphingobacteriales bacterium JAD_PAG50586_3]|nr:MAG: hypothetical protein M0D57_04665 [Sphingobacteriales bacterium JAD_PAG50586_3]